MNVKLSPIGWNFSRLNHPPMGDSFTFWSVVGTVCCVVWQNLGSSHVVVISCSMTNYCYLLIGQLVSAAKQPTNISCSLANQFQLLIGKLTSVAHWPTIATCSLANWCQLLNSQPISAAHWSTDISCSLYKWCQLLIGILVSAAH